MGENYSEEGDREQRLLDSSGHSYISFVVADRLRTGCSAGFLAPALPEKTFERQGERAFAAEGIAGRACRLCARQS